MHVILPKLIQFSEGSWVRWIWLVLIGKNIDIIPNFSIYFEDMLKASSVFINEFLWRDNFNWGLSIIVESMYLQMNVDVWYLNVTPVNQRHKNKLIP